ncbi:MAG: hypothetical protein ACE5JB_04365 [bacterium]
MKEIFIKSPQKGLSIQQWEILLDIFEITIFAEEHGHDLIKIYAPCWGICWQPSKRNRGDWSFSKSASMSRSLRRLESRGLIERKNDISCGRRTTYVKLTDIGRMVVTYVYKIIAKHNKNG